LDSELDGQCQVTDSADSAIERSLGSVVGPFTECRTLCEPALAVGSDHLNELRNSHPCAVRRVNEEQQAASAQFD